VESHSLPSQLHLSAFIVRSLKNKIPSTANFRDFLLLTADQQYTNWNTIHSAKDNVQKKNQKKKERKGKARA
jgi:hypothetical protein